MKKISFLLFIIMLVLIGCAKANDPLQENHKMNITHIYPTSGNPSDMDTSTDKLFIAEDFGGYHIYNRLTNQHIYNASSYLFAGVTTYLSVKYIAYHEPTKSLLLVNRIEPSNWQIELYNATDPSHPVYIDMASGDTMGITDLLLEHHDDPDSALYFLYRVLPSSNKVISAYTKSVTTPPVFVNHAKHDFYIPNKMSLDDNYVYVTFGLKGVIIYDKHQLRKLNINQPIVNIVGEFDTPGFALDVKVKDNYAYVADKYAGLQVFRFDANMNATLIKTFDTDGYAENVEIKNNYVAVSSTSGGVYLYDISNPEKPFLADRLPMSKVGYVNNVHFSKYGQDNTLFVASRDKGVLKVEID